MLGVETVDDVAQAHRDTARQTRQQVHDPQIGEGIADGGDHRGAQVRVGQAGQLAESHGGEASTAT
jgi:hypothetical protein